MLLSKRQEAELVTAIQGRGEIPLKFAYLGEGAKHWFAISQGREEGEGINSIQTKLLKKRINDFLSTINPKKGINIVDLGCGDGTQVLSVLEGLNAKKIKFNYVPLDISQEMLDLAVSVVSKEYPGINCKPILIDFELGQFSDVMYDLKQNGFDNLMLYLGTTLGNHSDTHRVLSNFRDSMTSKEYLIIGVELTNLAKVSRLFPQYKGKAVDDFLTFIPKEFKIPRDAFELETSWNSKDSQIEIVAQFKKDVNVGIAQEKFIIYKNENILLARSIKFTEYSITLVLEQNF